MDTLSLIVVVVLVLTKVHTFLDFLTFSLMSIFCSGSPPSTSDQILASRLLGLPWAATASQTPLIPADLDSGARVLDRLEEAPATCYAARPSFGNGLGSISVSYLEFFCMGGLPVLPACSFL